MKKPVSESNNGHWRGRAKASSYLIAPAVLPDGDGGFTPCPELLTESEAIRYLRLDVDSSSNPEGTLKHYRDKGQLTAIRVGRKNRYRRADLDNFLAEKSELKSRQAN